MCSNRKNRASKNKRPAAEHHEVDFTVTLQFTAGNGNSADTQPICGIRPEVLTNGSGLFQRMVAERGEQRHNGGDGNDKEVLTIPMLSGDVETMRRVLEFLGSECASDEAKKHCWPLPLGDLPTTLGSKLFHPSVLKWLRRFKSAEELVKVLALAHYIDAEVVVEVVGTFLAREVLLLVQGSPSFLSTEEDDPFQVLSLHVKMMIAKRLSPLLLTQHIDMHFPSLVDALALCDDIWSWGWSLFSEFTIDTWNDQLLGLARILRQRCRLLQATGNLPTASVIASVKGVSIVGANWKWLKKALRTFGKVMLCVDPKTPNEDWREMFDLLSRNKTLTSLSLTFDGALFPQQLVDCIATMNLRELVLDFTDVNDEERQQSPIKAGLDTVGAILKIVLPQLVFLEHFACQFYEFDYQDDLLADILAAAPNLKSLSLFSSIYSLNDVITQKALEALVNYNPHGSDDGEVHQFVCTFESPYWEDVELFEELKAIPDKNPCVRLRSQSFQWCDDTEVPTTTLEWLSTTSDGGDF